MHANGNAPGNHGVFLTADYADGRRCQLRCLQPGTRNPEPGTLPFGPVPSEAKSTNTRKTERGIFACEWSRILKYHPDIFDHGWARMYTDGLGAQSVSIREIRGFIKCRCRDSSASSAASCKTRFRGWSGLSICVYPRNQRGNHSAVASVDLDKTDLEEGQLNGPATKRGGPIHPGSFRYPCVFLPNEGPRPDEYRVGHAVEI